MTNRVFNFGFKEFDADVALSGTPQIWDINKLKKGLHGGGNPNSSCIGFNDGAPALHLWSMIGNYEAVNLLVTRGAKVHYTDNHSRTSLQYACAALNLENSSSAELIVNLLIEKGAKLKTIKCKICNNCSFNKRITPLMWAAWAGNYFITNRLINLGASTRVKDDAGNNALFYAKNPKLDHQTFDKNRVLTINLLEAN